MKKGLQTLLLMLFLPILVFSQEEQVSPKVTVGGYVRYEFIFDTYESADTRDGEVYLYPLRERLDAFGEDINKNININMLGLQARPRIAAKGIKAFGADVSGVLEGDFLGISQNDTRMLRLRHGFVSLKWSGSELVMGHTWHPMFVTECFPATISMGAGVPFHVLNRAPQIRYTKNIGPKTSLMGALLVHGYHKSTGPAEAQRQSGLPDAQVQLKYKSDKMFASFTAGYKFLKPRLVTDNNVVTDETIGSFNTAANLKLLFSPVTIKVEGIYGQNLTNFVMIGGYGAAENPDLVDDYSYSNINTMSVWSDISYAKSNMEIALFGGFSSNINATNDYYSLSGYTRGEDLKSIFRVSPRIVFKSGNVDIGIEYMITGAKYGDVDYTDARYRFTSTDAFTMNHRMLLAVKYSF